LYIGEKEMLNSLWNSYHFTSEEQKMISLYITEEWILKNRAYFIFWDNIWNSKDSRKFWGIWKSDIIWKFEFK
jgi:hypothetical protein